MPFASPATPFRFQDCSPTPCRANTGREGRLRIRRMGGIEVGALVLAPGRPVDHRTASRCLNTRPTDNHTLSGIAGTVNDVRNVERGTA